MTQLELRARRVRLESVKTTGRRVELLDTVGSALRRVRRCCDALETSLADVAGTGSAPTAPTLVNDSLKVRKQYGLLCEAIDATCPPEGATVYARLEAVAERMARLRGLALYAGLRLRDRTELEALRQRIDATCAAADDLPAALRLWQDLVGFGNMIAQINRRQELVEHDSKLAARMLLELEGPTLNPWQLRSVRALRGAGHEVDVLLRGDSDAADAWREALSSVSQRGAQTHGASDSTGWEA
jgi:hypothetical protein